MQRWKPTRGIPIADFHRLPGDTLHVETTLLPGELITDPDPIASPMKAKGVGELGICGSSAAVANAIYNATGVRVRDYPITLDKLLDRLPQFVPPVVS